MKQTPLKRKSGPPRRGRWLTCAADNCDAHFYATQGEIRRGARYCSRSCAMRDRDPPSTATGPDHHSWKGDAASVGAKRMRTVKRYPLGPCEGCGEPGRDRHHRDGNPGNNEPENIAILCRRCHMTEDGRIERFRENARRNGRKRSVFKKCRICSRTTKKITRGRCYTCDMFWRRTGEERDPARESKAALAWWRAVAVGRKCLVCGKKREIQGHHAVSQQRLRSRAADLGLMDEALLWDPRVGMAVCRPCHVAHEGGSRRIPRELVPPAAQEFARDFGLEWSLDRDYGPVTSPVSSLEHCPATQPEGGTMSAVERWQEMAERLERRGNILAKALKQWRCEWCGGSGQKNDYGGEVESGPCHHCDGEGMHPVARKALDESAYAWLNRPEHACSATHDSEEDSR